MQLFKPPDVEKLARSGDRQGLVRALGHKDPRVAARAARALGSLGDPYAVDALADALSTDRHEVRAGVLQGLVDALGSRRSEVRKHASKALVEHGSESVECLVEALRDANGSSAEQVVTSLGKIGDSRALAGLVDALGAGAPPVRRAAASALGKLRDPQAAGPLIAALEDPDPQLRERAARALGGVRDSRAVDPLLDALRDGPATVRVAAAHALGELSDERAVDGLVDALANDSSLQEVVVRALGKFDAPVVEPLVARLERVDPDGQERLAAALAACGDQGVRALASALHDERPEIRSAAARALATLDDETLAPLIPESAELRKAVDEHARERPPEKRSAPTAPGAGPRRIKHLLILLDREPREGTHFFAEQALDAVYRDGARLRELVEPGTKVVVRVVGPSDFENKDFLIASLLAEWGAEATTDPHFFVLTGSWGGTGVALWNF